MSTEGSHPVPSGQSEVQSLDDFRHLVREAFDQAHRSGKPDWTEMTSAVLKNRLLNLTAREFSEQQFGAPSFISLVRRVPDVIEIIDDRPPFRLRIRAPTTPPPIGELVRPSGPSQPAVSDEPRELRVRDDLWRSVIDYRSGLTYIFDSASGAARPWQATDKGQPELPTVSHSDVSSWRWQFVATVEPLDDQVASELRHWAERGGRVFDLPPAFRKRWAEFLKRQVVDRLESWFRSHQLPIPNDLLVPTAGTRLQSSNRTGDVVQVQQLRNLLVRAAREMTPEELAMISLPASVVLRLQSGAR
jgi:hypothetical protein